MFELIQHKSKQNESSSILYHFVSTIIDPFGEDVSLLYPDNHGDKFARFVETPCETPIIKGVVNQLRKWPADMLFAFLTACLIIGSLGFLIFLTVTICVPTVVGNRCLDNLHALYFSKIIACILNRKNIAR